MSSRPESQPPFSLLWPDGHPPDTVFTLSPQTARDVGLQAVIERLSAGNEQQQAITDVFFSLPVDPRIICYRQEILHDLRQHPRLIAVLQRLMPTIEALAAYHFRRDPRGEVRESTDLYEVTWRLGELEGIVACVSQLDDTLTAVAPDLHSAGLQALHREVQRIAADPVFQELTEKLPDWLAQVRASQSVTVGINLDAHLQPHAAVLLSVNEKPFTEAGFLGKLLDRTGAKWRGIAPLRSAVPEEPKMMIGTPVPLPMPSRPNPLLAPLFRDLAQVLNKVCRPIADALQTYTQINGRLFVGLWRELIFYLTAVRFVERLYAASLPLCRPQIAPMEARVCEVSDGYNVALALALSAGGAPVDLSRQVVTNNVALGEDGRIQILTGPNQGGKTTYVQAVGLTQVLAQAGLLIPGSRARISPVDGIYTHFPVEEKAAGGSGRFAEEAQRLSDIFARATRHSLLLLNESLTSTSAGESLYLTQDLVRAMRLVGTRAVLATHMHELAAGVDALNQDTPGDSRVVSLVASRVESADDGAAAGDGPITRSYRIQPGPPMGRSFARELAVKYGIGYEQLVELLHKRGLLPDDAPATKGDR